MGRGLALVGMSGGVDSAVAAALLQREGFEVVGVTLRLWPCGQAEPDRACCSSDDLVHARQAADRLGIPLRVLDVHELFRREVLEPAWRDYDRGRTPNPCVGCNERVKFRVLLQEADRLGGAVVATGHHARLERSEGRIRLLRGRDQAKDQSYFLFRLLQGPLERLRFPIGAHTKEEVRALARQLGLSAAERPESQDACFVAPRGGRTGFAEALRAYLGERARPGEVVDPEGRVLGRHPGLHRFTVGQRRGIGVASRHGRLYVLRLEPSSARVVVGPEGRLAAPGLVAREVCWADGPVAGPVLVQIRYRHRAVAAEVEPVAGGRALVRFAAPQRAVTPGQAAVFYRGEEVVGGGWIERALAEDASAGSEVGAASDAGSGGEP